MKEYEVTAVFLNGCAGASRPQTFFEEVELENPDDYVRMKHGREYPMFVKEIVSDTQIKYCYDNGTVTYIYEFAEI